jgi:hypothetical protein
LAGIFFARPPFGAEWFWAGLKTPVSKKPEWALIAVLGLNIAHMGFGHFAGFFKIARIGKPGILRGFRGWYSLFCMVACVCQVNVRFLMKLGEFTTTKRCLTSKTPVGFCGARLP